MAGRYPLADRLMQWAAQDLVFGIVAVAVAMWLWLLRSHTRGSALRLGIAMTAAVVVALAAGLLLHRLASQPRPFVAEPDTIRLLIPHAANSSMPSDHALFTFAVGGTLMRWVRPVGVMVLVAAFLIGTARVYVGGHWPADVLVGALIGLTAGTLAACLLQHWHFGGLPRRSRSSVSRGR